MKKLQRYGVFLWILTIIISLSLSMHLNPLLAESQIIPSFQIYSLTNNQIVSTRSLMDEQGTFFAIGFNPKKQGEIEQWMQKVGPLKKEGLLGNVIEVAVMEPRYKAFHNQAQAFMKKAIQSKSLMPFVYSGHTDTNALRITLKIRSLTDTVYVYCNSRGQILWLTILPFNTIDFNLLKERLVSHQT